MWTFYNLHVWDLKAARSPSVTARSAQSPPCISWHISKGKECTEDQTYFELSKQFLVQTPVNVLVQKGSASGRSQVWTEFLLTWFNPLQYSWQSQAFTSWSLNRLAEQVQNQSSFPVSPCKYSCTLIWRDHKQDYTVSTLLIPLPIFQALIRISQRGDTKLPRAHGLETAEILNIFSCIM